MDYIATFLGLELPTLKARHCISHHFHRLTAQSSSNSAKIVWGLAEDPWDLPPKNTLQDDETASTLSDCDDCSLSSSSTLPSASVTFAAPLVTEVHLRPYTCKSERGELYYREADFQQFRMEFRMECRRSLARQKESVVSFSDQVETHTLPVVENKEEIYYSADELKEFLEDFILSLDEKQS